MKTLLIIAVIHTTEAVPTSKPEKTFRPEQDSITETNCWFSIGSRANTRLTCYKQGPGCKVKNQPNNKFFFLVCKCFLLLLFFCFVYFDQTENRRTKNVQKTSLQNYKN